MTKHIHFTKLSARGSTLALALALFACGSADDVGFDVDDGPLSESDGEPTSDVQAATATPAADFDLARAPSGVHAPVKTAALPLVARTRSTREGLDPATRAELTKVGRIEHTFSDGRVIEIINSERGNFGTGDAIMGKLPELPDFIEGMEFGTRSLTTDDDDDRWPNNVIPFEFHSSVSSSEQATIRSFIADWNRDSPIIRFRDAVGDEDRVEFVKEELGPNTCGRSLVGYSWSWDGAQDLEIDPDCFDPHTVLHEMGHAAGLHHEHQRCGRNGFVTVTSNAPSGDYGELCGDSRNSGDYDYGSIMHYFTPEPFLTTRAVPTGPFAGLPATAGRSTRLSQNDVNGLHELYFKKVFSTTSGYAFAWAQQTTGTFDTFTNWSANSAASTGPRATVRRLSTGKYRVDFPKVGQEVGGNVQVTAYGNDANRCKVESWISSGETLQVTVRCNTPSGALADGRFVATYQRLPSPTAAKGGYLYSNRINAEGAYTPDPWYQWNSAGQRNRVTRTDVGRYNVEFPGVSINGGTVRLTAFGPNSDYCTIDGWGSSSVGVSCFATNGTAKDSAFSIDFTDSAFTGTYGYAWANEPSTARYVPAGSWQKVEILGVPGAAVSPVVINRSSVGNYLVEIPGVAPFSSAVTVSAYGSNNNCKVASWNAGASVGPNLADRRENVNVLCFNASGAPADSFFAMTYMTNEVVIP